jgi:hypothetical protein
MHLSLPDDGGLWLYGTEQFRPKGLTVPVRLIDVKTGNGGVIGERHRELGGISGQHQTRQCAIHIEDFGAQQTWPQDQEAAALERL